MNVTLREAQGSLTAELQEAGAFYSQRMQNAKIEAVSFPSMKGKWTGLHVHGETAAAKIFPIQDANEARSYLVAVTVFDGIAAWVVLKRMWPTR